MVDCGTCEYFEYGFCVLMNENRASDDEGCHHWEMREFDEE
jgi:hypothetical protein